MKKKIITLLLLSLVMGQWSFSQQKQLTLEQAVIGRWRGLAPENIQRLTWIPETARFSFLENKQLMENHARKDQKKAIISLKQLNQFLPDTVDAMKQFPHFRWVGTQKMLFQHNHQWFLVDPYQKQMIESIRLSKAASNSDYCHSSRHIAYTIENNLFIRSFSEKAVQITHAKDKGIVNGQEVHRREFGIHTGTFWSPQGNKLAYYRKDERMVTDYPLVKINNRVAGKNPVKYPMAGMKSHHVRVGIYDLNSRDTIYMKTGTPRDHYLTNVQWGPEGKHIYIALLNRDQDHMKLNRYDAATGNLEKTLFEETHDKYVEPLHPVTFVPGKKDRFIWMSRRDGYNHIYLYNTEGKLLRQLTQGEWEVTAMEGFDSQGKTLFFTATKESPLERHLYRLRLSSAKISKLTREPGYHQSEINPHGSWVMDRFSSLNNPNTIQILNQNGRNQRKLLESKNPLKEYDLGEMEISTLKAGDGKTDLYYRLIKPTDFDPQKKYPAIIYVYGGPHAQLIQNRWLGGARLWQHYMAQKGFVMLTLDNRGSANRGREFENVIHRRLGKYELADQMKGAERLKNLDYVDETRIGVHGWSYGGFMTTSMMLKKPGVFQVGVAGGPVIDWKYYEVMYGERYMDTPQDNPKGYHKANLKNYVNNLEGDLMLIQGYLDDVVVPQHSLSFIRKSVEQNVQVDYFIYPRHQHNVRGRDRMHLMRKITQYFEDHL